MSYGTGRATMEAKLAIAHRALEQARKYADEAGLEGAWLDITQILVEVQRVAEDSLRGGGRRNTVLKGQMSF
jgi:hypothetical protein